MLNTLAYEPTNAEKDYHQYMKKKTCWKRLM